MPFKEKQMVLLYLSTYADTHTHGNVCALCDFSGKCCIALAKRERCAQLDGYTSRFG